MDYIKEIENRSVISFGEINCETPPEVAAEIRQEMVGFLRRNSRSKKKLELEFGGKSRMSSDFADELFKDNRFKKYPNQVVVRQMHLFDRAMVPDDLKQTFVEE
jgi:hypothetical protein